MKCVDNGKGFAIVKGMNENKETLEKELAKYKKNLARCSGGVGRATYNRCKIEEIEKKLKELEANNR